MIQLNVPAQTVIDDIRTSNCASFWIKNAIAQLIGRDCLDALKDAELLVAIMRKRYEEITETFHVSEPRNRMDLIGLSDDQYGSRPGEGSYDYEPGEEPQRIED